MNSATRSSFAYRSLTWFIAVIVGFVLLLTAAIAVLGLTAAGNQFLANRIAALVSTPDMQINIDGARGLLAGQFHIDRITLSDTKGRFASADDLTIVWSPSELLSMRFHANRIAAGKIEIDRTPVKTIESESSGDAFSLPVEVRLDSVDAPTIALGQTLAGRETELALKGAAQAVSDRIALDLTLAEKTRPDAVAKAKIAYAVNARTLGLDASVSEPQGGLLARLLSLPGLPPVEITAKGDGPLDDWQGEITGNVDGRQVLDLNGSHRFTSNMHTVVLSGGGQVAELLPPTMRPLFEGLATVDVNANFDDAGAIRIETGSVTTGSFVLTAKGGLDPKGEASLTASVAPVADTVDIDLPLASGTLATSIGSASLTLSGPFQAAKLDLAATIASLTTPQAQGRAISVSAHSVNVNLGDRTGLFAFDLKADTLSMADASLAKVVEGPVDLKGQIVVEADRIALTQSEISSARIGGAVTASFVPSDQTAAADFSFHLLAQGLLPASIERKIDRTVGLSGHLTATLPDTIAIENLQLTSNIFRANGSAGLDQGVIRANIAGNIDDLANFTPDLAGQAQIILNASGPLAAPQISVEVQSASIKATDRLLETIAIRLDAKVASQKITGSLVANAKMDGQVINLNADLARDDGLISIPNLKADIGTNILSGAVTLDSGLLPAGQIKFNLRDIALVARLAGQAANGAMAGTIDLANTDGKITGAIQASGPMLRSGGAEIANPSATIKIVDLAALQFSGKVSADHAVSGTARVEAIDLDLALDDGQTRFDLTSRFDKAPLTVQGTIAQRDESVAIDLSSFVATPKGIPVKLAKPSQITVTDGIATLGDLEITLGNGSILVAGRAGRTLDLQITARDLPLALANSFAKDLNAAGNLSADITVTGQSASPVVTFTSTATQIATSQTRGMGLPDLSLSADGRFADNMLSVNATGKLRDQPLKIMGEVNLAGNRIALPAIGVDIGKSKLAGTLTLDSQFLPNGRITYDIPDVAALAAIAGRKAEGALKGTVDLASDAGKVNARIVADGIVRNQPITALVDLQRQDGALALPSLKVDIGKNTVSGALTLDAQMMPSGKISFDLPDLALLAALAGQKAEGALQGSADVTSASGRIETAIKATGTIRDQAIDVAVQALSDQGKISLPAFSVDMGANRLDGALSFDAALLPTGKISFDMPDIGLFAAFAGQKAEGAVSGSADIRTENGKLAGTISAKGAKISASGAEILNPVVDLTIADLTTGEISGKVSAERVASGANVLSKLVLDITRAGPKTGFSLKSQYDGAPLVAQGKIAQGTDGLALTLNSFSAAPKKIPVKLGKPTQVAIRNGTASLSGLAISAGNGSIVVTGTAGDKLGMTAKISALPASLANAFSSGLDASGTISSNIKVSGTATAPVVSFDANWQNASTGQIRAAGLNSFAVTAKGQLAANVLRIDVKAQSNGGLTLDANGTVGVTGANPLAIKVIGQLPFEALAGQLAPSGVVLTGNARFDVAVSGNAAAPALNGKITTSGATLTVIRQNLTIGALAATVNLNGQQAQIANMSGKLAGGGTLSVTGTVGIASNSGFPANLKIALKDAVYTDGKLVAAKLTGDLGLNGSLVSSPELNGRIRIARADITIPEKLPGALSQIDIKHRNAPVDVKVQEKQIKSEQSSTKTDSGSGGIRLELKISAPRRIFVRGRGLDAELGGEVGISGNSQAPLVSGGFKMLRGRLSVIGRRLDFTSGTITFGGNMTPALNMVASSTVSATVVNVVVSGLANNPQVTFTSSPALPQDEVLALLIFGRSAANLSPVQIAQLADAVSTLAGGQSNSLFNKLRQGLGVDDLDVGTDENGKSNVSAGKYLNKRTYLQFQQGVDDGTSKAVINLDIGKGVKLRGEAGSDGSGAGGIFFEKEY